MTFTIYMFYITDQSRACLWHSEKKDDVAAVKRAEEYLREKNAKMGKLYTGPTGFDEMKFVRNVTLG